MSDVEETIGAMLNELHSRGQESIVAIIRPALERLLTAERTAREQAERERDAFKAHGPMAESAGWLEPMAAAALLARAEQAEAARDDAQADVKKLFPMWDEMSRRFREEKAARERAEAELEKARADNAALLATLRRFREQKPPETHPDSAQAFVRWHMANERAADEALRALHPGAALLERLRALEKVRKAADKAHVCGKDECQACDDLSAALLAADALKEAP